MRGEQRIATIMDESIRRQDIPAKKTIRKPEKAIIIDVPKSG